MKHTVLFFASVFTLLTNTLYGRTADIFSAIAARDFQRVEKQLQDNPDLNIFSENGFTPLQVACRMGDDKLAALLIAFGANVNLPSKDSSTPLIEAARQGLADLTELLLINGADASYKDGNQMNALEYAADLVPVGSEPDAEMSRILDRLRSSTASFAESKH
ncbi:MAG: hypothetical protein RL021_1472 [Bacteroidota bacterium]|jgi:ankyrin repeat protein